MLASLTTSPSARGGGPEAAGEGGAVSPGRAQGWCLDRGRGPGIRKECAPRGGPRGLRGGGGGRSRGRSPRASGIRVGSPLPTCPSYGLSLLLRKREFLGEQSEVPARRQPAQGASRASRRSGEMTGGRRRGRQDSSSRAGSPQPPRASPHPLRPRRCGRTKCSAPRRRPPGPRPALPRVAAQGCDSWSPGRGKGARSALGPGGEGGVGRELEPGEAAECQK